MYMSENFMKKLDKIRMSRLMLEQEKIRELLDKILDVSGRMTNTYRFFGQ